MVRKLAICVVAVFFVWVSVALGGDKKQGTAPFLRSVKETNGVWMRYVDGVAYVQFNAQIQETGSDSWHGVTISMTKTTLTALHDQMMLPAEHE